MNVLIVSQDGTGYVLENAYWLVRRENKIYIAFQVNGLFDEWDLGEFESEERAARVLNWIYDAVGRGEKIFRIPDVLT